jgi:hypothetical protein
VKEVSGKIVDFQQGLCSEIGTELHQVQQKVEEFKGKLNQVVTELRADIIRLGDRVEHCEQRPDVISGIADEDDKELWSDMVSK